ncbi:hypothetical protein [Stutzerimonas nitrititolerans]|uniref:hypothetical protein n=1 Tax=Stutzerimonas nitrititolerans TaxID=2482751 RepID=UPI0028AEA5B4|nr:hypothetical protein [Stutzerimonas nitrititolerans]
MTDLNFTTTQRLARLEAAQEMLGFLVAVRAEWISAERKKTQPDTTKIAQWEAEQTSFFDLEDDLRLDNLDAIEQVIATYGPVARRLFKSR